MSSPMPPQMFVDQLRAAGVKVIEMTVNGVNWKNNNRNSKGLWENLHGIVEHHTGSDTTDPTGYARFLFLGSSALIGPLCQFSTAPDGTIYMIGWGRCNHAGGGDPAVRDMVINNQIPYDREVKPAFGNLDGVDGNREYYGNEIMYNGAHPMTEQQSRSSTIAYGIICKYHGWRGNSVIAHREWSKDKPDPGFQSLPARRNMVNQYLDGTFGGIDVALDQNDIDRIAVAVLNWEVTWVEPYTQTIGPASHPKQSLSNLISWNEEYTARFAKFWSEQTVAAVQKSILDSQAAIAKAIADDPNVDIDSSVVEAAVAKGLASLKWTVDAEQDTNATV